MKTYIVQYSTHYSNGKLKESDTVAVDAMSHENAIVEAQSKLPPRSTIMSTEVLTNE